METIVCTTVEVELAQKLMVVDDIRMEIIRTFRSSVAQSHCRELRPWLGQFSHRATSNSGSKEMPKLGFHK